MNKPIERQFDLPSVLAGISGVTIARKTGGVDAVLQFMTGDRRIKAGQKFPDDVVNEILNQHRVLVDACLTKPSAGGVKQWARHYKEILGDHVMLRPMNSTVPKP